MGQQRSLRWMPHFLSWALARSPVPRWRAWARSASFVTDVSSSLGGRESSGRAVVSLVGQSEDSETAALVDWSL